MCGAIFAVDTKDYVLIGVIFCRHKSECGGSYESMGLQTLTPVQMKARKGICL
jgi:hypothetical protein